MAADAQVWRLQLFGSLCETVYIDRAQSRWAKTQLTTPDYRYHASVVVGCPGGELVDVADGPVFRFRPRAGAQLEFVEADCDFWAKQINSPDTGKIFDLGNATKADFLAALGEALSLLNAARPLPNANGGSLDLIFCGHGTPSGSLVLRDDLLAMDEIIEIIASGVSEDVHPLKLSVVLDCCYSGLPLAQALTHSEHGSKFILIDGFAASLHDEKAYELLEIGHGVLTYTMKNKGNKHVDRAELARAVNQNDGKTIRAALQCWVPNPATYLTSGKQHSIEVINGHAIDVHGLGRIEINHNDVRISEVLAAFETLRRRCDMNELIEL